MNELDAFLITLGMVSVGGVLVLTVAFRSQMKSKVGWAGMAITFVVWIGADLAHLAGVTSPWIHRVVHISFMVFLIALIAHLHALGYSIFRTLRGSVRRVEKAQR